MSTVPALLALALATVLPATARAERPRTTTSFSQHDGDMTGRFGYAGTGPLTPSVTLELRGAIGGDEALLGPRASGYRAQPEVQLGLHPASDLEIFGGGGLGAAYVQPAAGVPGLPAGPTLSISGALGVRFPLSRVTVSAIARTESVRGYGTAVTLDLALAFSEGR